MLCVAAVGSKYLPVNVFKSKVTDKPKTPPIVDPVTVIATANLALNVIKLFSGSSKSMMLALMSYQIELLKVLSAQLDEIQKDISNILIAISALPDEISSALRNQYKTELLESVNASLNRYNHNIISGTINNIGHLNNEEVRNEIRDILFRLDQTSQILRGSSSITEPETCLITPIVMSLEVACRSNLNFPKEYINGIIISKYQNWFKSLLSNEKFSITYYMHQYASEHDIAIESLKDNNLAKIIDFNVFKIKGSQKSNSYNFYYVVTNLTMSGKIIENLNEMPTGLISGIYHLLQYVEDVKIKGMDVKLLKLSKIEAIASSDLQEINFVKPKEKTRAFLGNVIKKLTRDEMFKEYEKSEYFKSHLNEVDQINRVITIVNKCRANLEMCMNASTVANNSLKRVDEYLNFGK